MFSSNTVGSSFNTVGFQASLADVNNILRQKETKKSKNKLSDKSVTERREKGLFYNVSYVFKGKKGSIKTPKMAKNEVPPSLFTPSRTAKVFDVLYNDGSRVPIHERISDIIFFDVQNMLCGKIPEIDQYLRSFGRGIVRENLVCFLDFAPHDKYGTYTYPASYSKAANEFMKISRAFLAKKGEKIEHDMKKMKEMAISGDHPDLIADLWENRIQLKVDVSESRRIEIYEGIVEKIVAPPSGGDLISSFPAIDISKYEGFGRSTIGSVRETKYSKGEFAVDPATNSYIGDSAGIHRLFVLIPPMEAFGKKSILVAAKRIENVRFFLTDMTNAYYLKAKMVGSEKNNADLDFAANIVSRVSQYFTAVVPRIKGEKKVEKGTGLIRLNKSAASTLTASPPRQNYDLAKPNSSSSSSAAPPSRGLQGEGEGVFEAATGTASNPLSGFQIPVEEPETTGGFDFDEKLEV